MFKLPRLSLGTDRQVPLPTLLVYSMGVLTAIYSGALFPMVNPIFNIEVGVDIAILGMILAGVRIFDAFTDPLFANWTDNLRSKFGRRRPFIVLGGIACGLIFALGWMFPTPASSLVSTADVGDGRTVLTQVTTIPQLWERVTRGDKPKVEQALAGSEDLRPLAVEIVNKLIKSTAFDRAAEMAPLIEQAGGEIQRLSQTPDRTAFQVQRLNRLLLEQLGLSIAKSPGQWDPGWSKTAYAVWFGFFVVLMSFGTTAFGSAYYALGNELPADYKDRTRLFSIRSIFEKTSRLLIPWLYPLVQLTIFGTAVNGMQWVGAILGGIMITSAVISGLMTPERFGDSAEIKSMPKIKLFSAVKETCQNRYFWLLTGCGLALSAGLTLFDSLALYINVFYVYGGDRMAGAVIGGWGNTLATVLSLVCIPLVWWLANKYGKHIIIRWALAWMIIGSILKWWLYTPEYPYLQLLLPFFYSVGISSFFVLLGSMMPDVVDVDELKTGRRREAMFGALGSYINKLSISGAVALSGWVIVWTGFNQELGAAQDPQVFVNMRFLYSFAAAAFFGIALGLIWMYDLTPEKSESNRQELLRRRAQRNQENAAEDAAGSGGSQQKPQ